MVGNEPADAIIAQPSALEIARGRLTQACDPVNAQYEDVMQAHAQIGILAALIALAEQAGRNANALGLLADSRRRQERWE